MFPGHESDFFRNRLTHSIEVYQIARSIACRLNISEETLENNFIDLDIIEFAGLAHDLGHPPFGHVGEYALDFCMKPYGGFEGNAQTLRILTKLEKKGMHEDTNEKVGLNLTYRTLASILKYDEPIPNKREVLDSLAKGYYMSELDLVNKIKENVTGQANFKASRGDNAFKTIECSIMDLADDIAYSTYDLEDAFKGNFLTPLNFLNPSDKVLEEMTKRLNKKASDKNYTRKEIKSGLREIFAEWCGGYFEKIVSQTKEENQGDSHELLYNVIGAGQEISENVARDGYSRNYITSTLVDQAINSVCFHYNDKIPALSSVSFSEERKFKVELLKNFVYVSIIESSLISVPSYRGYEIVRFIFNSLSNEERNKEGYKLLPIDYKNAYEEANEKEEKYRVICDFIAGMTDRYAIEFYGRLTSENPETIFKQV
ncbi:deoxyguanosinetriphosphate triphosphohydrolase [Sporocytophaga myxococcoides]|uniref:Deoxyguanosinetriphosphate triphosphohydrolase n=1 Tax=Sporocytophaga myxococcoides TaxID=153721 RepID=A0A098LCY2_9BACT|nr:deoxyguanosinetriphosphate triphosphohydrolase [Sporocytophaga myxococcoides]